MIYTTSEAMRSIAAAIREGKGRAGMSAAYLRWKADEAAARRTECLTDFVSPAVSGNNHDFFSEGPYWWPNPKNPGGPYIRRDGEVNPDRFEDHDRVLGRICGDALILTLAAYHLDERHYAETALEKIHAFFVNPETKMNPHLDYAQAIRGVCSGRGIGIIDATCLHQLIFAVDLLGEMGIDNETTAGVRQWIREMYVWLRTSKNGLDEKHHGNNHSIWYTSLTMAMARLINDEEGFASDCEYFAELTAKQLTDEGAYRDETTRTNSFTYCCFSITAAAAICEIAHFAGVDLWNRDFGEGKSMSAAIRWIAPFFVSPYKWQFQQINGAVGDAPAAMLAASVRLSDEEGVAAAKRAMRARSSYDPYRYMGPVGPTEFYFAK